VRKRTAARELALKLLYQYDLRGEEALGEMDALFEQEKAPPTVREFARQIVEGCRLRWKDLGRVIQKVASNWALSRMAVVDRNVLRIGAWEILVGETPPAVAIDEAVDLAKKYSTAQSGAFVNGVLDSLRKRSDELKKSLEE